MHYASKFTPTEARYLQETSNSMKTRDPQIVLNVIYEQPLLGFKTPFWEIIETPRWSCRFLPLWTKPTRGWRPVKMHQMCFHLLPRRRERLSICSLPFAGRQVLREESICIDVRHDFNNVPLLKRIIAN